MRFVFLLLPWLELFTLIELGIKTSALTALAYVLATVIIGMAILQYQGRGILERLSRARGGGIIGPDLLLDDMAMGLAGILLIVPGLISDVIAVLVMIGPLRRRLLRAFWGDSRTINDPGRNTGSPETIEGEFRRIDDKK